ncbi:acetoin utilization protein AcuB [Desulfonispora thiosulfatigenes DSM 11270]|uniref:Acetoin utilization protein AcuB n=1 Tax=Desulfonispora thiosulfatigenes DSM 11270 TaxID=656914 RepID=A0A1W1UDU7_DESTI|nr:CBS and ACT domain-containing protein [Desulfonispora thiosulfatigenes]SMB79268.1 acetoin utilization protein AcuB [Desulfonispora thiosulfatigenes DSM 11270]
MFVKSRMTANPYTISPKDIITDAFEIMSKHKIRRLPVLEGGKLVGIVTEKELQKVTPSNATTLSIYEVNYLLAKATVKDAMSKNPIAISEDALLEEAAILMRDNRIGALPVMRGDKLVGIITETDIFDAFIDLLGFRDAGTRITVEAKDVPGSLSEMSSILKSFGVNVSHIAVYKGSGSTSDVIIRINSSNTTEIEQALMERGYKVIHVLKSYDNN